MATSFADAFGPDFLSSLGSDNPDPSLIPGVGQQPDPVQLPPVAAPMQGQQDNVLQQLSDQGGNMQPTNFDGANLPATYGGQPVDPNTPQTAQPSSLYAPAPQLGQVQAPPDTAAAPRQRLSFLDVIGKIGNVLANAHTGAAQYLTPLQQAQQAQLAQQQVDAGALDNRAKAQDIAQTGVATTQNANQVVGGYARGLQALQKAGSNLDVAAPALAKQMGIPENQAADILSGAKQDPNFLGTLADTADAQKPGAGPKFANQPLYTKDANGVIHVNQLSNAGGIQEAVLPNGQQVVIPGITDVNTGGKNIILDKFGHPVTSYTKSSAPGEDEGQVGTDANGNPIYNPLPHSLKAAQTTKTNLENVGTITKNNQAAAAAAQSQAAISSNISTIGRAIDTLDKLNAQPGPQQNAIGNLTNYLQGTAAGQAVSHVTNPQVAQARDQIKAAGQALLVAAAHGNGQLFKNKTEQQNFQNMINNPQSSVQTMRNALRNVQIQLQPPSAQAAPARSTLTPTYKVTNW